MLPRGQAIGDPQHAFRSWSLKYRSMNPITNYSSNYIAPQAEALEKFEKDHPGAKVTFTFQDKRALVKNDKDSKRNELVKLTPAEQRSRNRQQNIFTKFMDNAMAQNDAEIRCDPRIRGEPQGEGLDLADQGPGGHSLQR